MALWVASLTLALCATAAVLSASSSTAALAFLAVALVLAPPAQEWIAAVRHPLAPAKTAFFVVITALPLGLGALALDAVATLEARAQRLGFASAGHWGRAKDLGLATPQALAAHDEAQSRTARDALCRQRQERPPLMCFESGHQTAALAFADVRLGAAGIESAARFAIAEQRKAFLAVDKDCAELLDRIDQDALPVIIENRTAALAIAAGFWARHLSKPELETMTARARAGASYQPARDTGDLERRLATVAPAVEKDLDAALQAWARHIVLSEPGWRTFLKGRTPLAACRPAQTRS